MPLICRHLRGLATETREICGLSFVLAVRLSINPKGGEMIQMLMALVLIATPLASSYMLLNLVLKIVDLVQK